MTVAASIPVIDIAPLRDGGAAGTSFVGRAMRAAAESVGFFYVSNHGIPQSLIDAVERLAREFFARDILYKEQVKPLDCHRGFLSIGQARMQGQQKVDLKESFIWGLDIGEDGGGSFGEDDAASRADRRMIGPNRWPADMPHMRALFNEYFGVANNCGRLLLRGFAAGLGVRDDYFDAAFARPVSRCTAIFYPPQPPDAAGDQFGVAPHTDYGTLTLLHQDPVGGLQVKAREGSWIDAAPIPGTMVINVGDLLARWTNDRFASTAHRVINRSGRERLSIAAFIDPDFDTPILPVLAAREQPHYPPITCGEYILQRFDESFAYRRGNAQQ